MLIALTVLAQRALAQDSRPPGIVPIPQTNSAPSGGVAPPVQTITPPPQSAAPSPDAASPREPQGRIPAAQKEMGQALTVPNQSGAYQMSFDNVELRDLIRFISNVMGRNFIYDENVVKGKVTILSPKRLTKDEVYKVFETVMNHQGFSVVATPEAVKIVRNSDAKSMSIESVDEDGLQTTSPGDKFITYVHFLEYLDSNIVVGILRPMMSKDAYIVGVATSNSLIMIDTGSNIQRIKGVLGEIDVPVSKQMGSIKVYNAQHANASDLAKVLQGILAENKKVQGAKEKVFITAYAATNSLIINAPAEDMRDIERIIGEIDTLRPQVLVEAAIIEVSTTKGDEFGVEWLTGASTSDGRGAVGGFVQKGGPLASLGAAIASEDVTAVANALPGGLNIGVLGGNITFNGKTYPSVVAFIRALSTVDKVNILSTPQLLTKDNEEAEIIIGENRPYLTSTRLDASGNPIYSYDYRDVGVKLKIKPQINNDGFVYLNLYQEVSKVTEETTGGVVAPTTLKRSTKTTIVVKDSQTVVISGLIQDDSTGSQQGIPFLSSIPLIGRLFGYKKTTHDKTNLLVFLTPRIIYNAETLQTISDKKKQDQDRMIKRNKE